MNTVRTTVRRPAIRRAGIVVTALVALAACGDDDASTTSTAPAAGAATTGATGTTAAPATTASDGGLYGPSPTPADVTDSTAGGSDSTGAASDGAGGATVATAESDLGTILVDADGRTLYAFTPDTEGVPTCIDDCADAWPPAIVDGEIDAGDLDASVFTLVEHPAGGQQLKAGDFPLYLFAGDVAPGDVNGQGSGDVWFVVAPDGTLIES